MQFSNLKLGRMRCSSYNNRYCDLYISPIVGIGAIRFQSKKTANLPLFKVIFLSKRSGKIIWIGFP